MSEIAYVPPYLSSKYSFQSDALVDSTHFVGDIVKAFNPASFLNLSNSMGLKNRNLPNFHGKVANFLKIVSESLAEWITFCIFVALQFHTYIGAQEAMQRKEILCACNG